MKLGSLKAAIRDLKVAPKVVIGLGDAVVDIYAQKAPLLTELDRAFPGGKAVETGLQLDENGYLTAAPEPAAAVEVPPQSTTQPAAQKEAPAQTLAEVQAAQAKETQVEAPPEGHLAEVRESLADAGIQSQSQIEGDTIGHIVEGADGEPVGQAIDEHVEEVEEIEEVDEIVEEEEHEDAQAYTDDPAPQSQAT
jgi:hypothetical protein